MNINILSSLTDIAEVRNDTLVIGTHNGIFHSDEVVACAILSLANPNLPIVVLRSRDLSILNQCDVCVDIGGGRFDHHQIGFNKARENGIKYASAGLVWKEFGRQLIDNYLDIYFSKANCNKDIIFETFDNNFISLVDCEDNGIVTEKHCFSFISSFLPLWFNNSTECFNKQFSKVLLVTISVLEEVLKTTISKEVAKNTISSNWNNVNYFCNGILEIPSQTIDWLEIILELNNSTKSNFVNFVIFPYPNGGWAAQCVPPSLENKFNQRIAFPIEWAGQTNNLPNISGVKSALFCHNGRFFARANSKEDIIQMCTIATHSAK